MPTTTSVGDGCGAGFAGDCLYSSSHAPVLNASHWRLNKGNVHWQQSRQFVSHGSATSIACRKESSLYPLWQFSGIIPALHPTYRPPTYRPPTYRPPTYKHPADRHPLDRRPAENTAALRLATLFTASIRNALLSGEAASIQYRPQIKNASQSTCPGWHFLCHISAPVSRPAAGQ